MTVRSGDPSLPNVAVAPHLRAGLSAGLARASSQPRRSSAAIARRR
jgi:hypothetical protein